MVRHIISTVQHPGNIGSEIFPRYRAKFPFGMLVLDYNCWLGLCTVEFFFLFTSLLFIMLRRMIYNKRVRLCIMHVAYSRPHGATRIKRPRYCSCVLRVV